MPTELAETHHEFLKNGVCLHASAVNVSGKALVFLGHSTAGKSTISRLLAERYPIIADDKVFVFQVKKGGWMICDGSDNFPLVKGKANPLANQEKFPLLNVLRIFKAELKEITPASPILTCKYLVDAIFEVDRQRKQKDLGVIKKWFGVAAKISRQINGYRLTFPKDKSIINVIHDVFDESFFDDFSRREIKVCCERSANE